MGTTLQAPPFDSDIETALWSGELLRSEAGRAKLTKLHNLWIESGSDVLGSATYVSTFLRRASPPPDLIRPFADTNLLYRSSSPKEKRPTHCPISTRLSQP